MGQLVLEAGTSGGHLVELAGQPADLGGSADGDRVGGDLPAGLRGRVGEATQRVPDAAVDRNQQCQQQHERGAAERGKAGERGPGRGEGGAAGLLRRHDPADDRQSVIARDDAAVDSVRVPRQQCAIRTPDGEREVLRAAVDTGETVAEASERQDQHRVPGWGAFGGGDGGSDSHRLLAGEPVGEDPGHARFPCSAWAGQPVGTCVGGARRRPALDDGRARHPTVGQHDVDVADGEDAEVGEGELAFRRVGHQRGDGESAREPGHCRFRLGQRVGYRVGSQAGLEGDVPAGVVLRVLHRHESQPRPGAHDQDRHDPDDGRQLGPNRPAAARTPPLSAHPCPLSSTGLTQQRPEGHAP